MITCDWMGWQFNGRTRWQVNEMWIKSKHQTNHLTQMISLKLTIKFFFFSQRWPLKSQEYIRIFSLTYIYIYIYKSCLTLKIRWNIRWEHPLPIQAAYPRVLERFQKMGYTDKELQARRWYRWPQRDPVIPVRIRIDVILMLYGFVWKCWVYSQL